MESILDDFERNYEQRMSEEITLDEYRTATKQHKYGAKREEVDGYLFDSKKEAERYRQLKILERCGHIKLLNIKPRFPIVINETLICEYEADYSYFDVRKGEAVIEDCKGCKTPVYKLKKKLFEAQYGRRILET